MTPEINIFSQFFTVMDFAGTMPTYVDGSLLVFTSRAMAENQCDADERVVELSPEDLVRICRHAYQEGGFRQVFFVVDEQQGIRWDIERLWTTYRRVLAEGQNKSVR